MSRLFWGPRDTLNAIIPDFGFSYISLGLQGVIEADYIGSCYHCQQLTSFNIVIVSKSFFVKPLCGRTWKWDDRFLEGIQSNLLLIAQTWRWYVSFTWDRGKILVGIAAADANIIVHVPLMSSLRWISSFSSLWKLAIYKMILWNDFSETQGTYVT